MRQLRKFSAVPLMLAAAMSPMGLGRRFTFDPPEPDNAEQLDGEGGGTATAPPPAAPTDHIARLRREFSTLQGEAQGVIDLAARENRGLTDAEATANNTRFTRMTAIQALIAERQRFAALSIGAAEEPEEPSPAPQTRVATPRAVPGTAQFQNGQDVGRSQPNIRVADPQIDRAQFARALRNWAATGQMDRQFATITTATNSGVLLPRTIEVPIVPTNANVFREALAVYNLRPVTTTTTHEMTIPIMTMAAGAAVAETANAEADNDPDLSKKITLKPSTYGSGAAWFSNNVLQANDWDIIEWVQTDLLFAKELAVESAIAAALIADAGITNVVNTATVNGFTYANLVSLNNALPKKYDRFKVIFLSQTAWNAAEGMVDSTGKPILNLDPQNQNLRRFNGTPVMRCDYLEALGVTAKKVGFIANMMAFKLRDAGQQRLARYTNDKTRRDQTGLDLFGYHAFDWADDGVACFKTP